MWNAFPLCLLMHILEIWGVGTSLATNYRWGRVFSCIHNTFTTVCISLAWVMRWEADLDSVATLSELLGGEVILSLDHAHFTDTFQDLVPLLRISFFHLLGRSELLHQFFSHWNVLLHAQFQCVPVLRHSTQHNTLATLRTVFVCYVSTTVYLLLFKLTVGLSKLQWNRQLVAREKLVKYKCNYNYK